MMSIGRYLALGCLVLLAGCGGSSPNTPAAKPAPPVNRPAILFRSHFIGSSAAATRDGGTKLKEILALPSSQRLIEQTSKKLAASPPKLIPGLNPQNQTGATPLLEPLIEDLWRAESVLQCAGATNGTPEWTLAIRLAEERANAWDAAAQQWVTAWQFGPITRATNNGYAGWTARRSARPNTLAMVRAGDWLLTGIGNDKLQSLEEFLARIRASNHPLTTAPTNWLTLEADLPKLAHWLTNLASWNPPALALGVNGRGQSLRATGRLTFNQAVANRLPVWEVPTNSIRDPLVSFAATRGLDTWAASAPALTRFGLTPQPSQLFVWGQADFPFQTFAGLVVPDATNALTQLAAKIPTLIPTNSHNNSLGRIGWKAGNTEIQWEGLPIVNPFIRANPTAAPHLLLAGVFPASQSRTPMPTELLQQFLGHEDLVHYSWEVTQSRIAHWRALIQLPEVIQNLPLLPPEAAGQMWFEQLLQPVNNPVGQQALRSWPNTITEMSRRTPNQLEFVRNAPLGLDAFEIVQLVQWLDSETFPLPDRRPNHTLLEERRRRKQ